MFGIEDPILHQYIKFELSNIQKIHLRSHNIFCWSDLFPYNPSVFVRLSQQTLHN